ncbi:hypothetical protein [Autumnicola edwardsiae]|uniref:Lipoprotein n=1 Tax=Autumnicola edwardsiae TaxID=3075594 RepID=A0ABU3CZX8_9FLAO|nr:hypothetical protein [Zunongwangia sp. F297]MDT0651900.1 hypothetical protein [Zunongwangia sp. F297]
MIKFLTLALLILFTSCQNRAGKDSQLDSKNGLAIEDSLYSIVNYNQEMSYPFESGEPTDLRLEEIRNVEEILERAVKENNGLQKEALKEQNAENPENKWTETGFELEKKNYYRQYVPIINEKGEKVVWVNLSCRKLPENWQTELLPPVADGGNCYFNVKINLTRNTYLDLRINSYA